MIYLITLEKEVHEVIDMNRHLECNPKQFFRYMTQKEITDYEANKGVIEIYDKEKGHYRKFLAVVE